MSTAPAALVPVPAAYPVLVPTPPADAWAGLRERGRKAGGLLDHLNKTVIGQNNALRPIFKCVWEAESGLHDHGRRPKGVFLSFGPTGVGKTQTPREACAYLYGGEPLILSLNEFGQANSSASFKEAVHRKVKSAEHCGRWIVLDEIEKASRDVVDVMLSMFEEGRMLLPSGEYLLFNDYFITVTSNIGSAHLHEMVNRRSSVQSMRDFVFKEAQSQLRPELFARADAQVFYEPLSHAVQCEIMGLQLQAKLAHLSLLLGHAQIQVHPDVLNVLVGIGFHDQAQGARGVRQIVREHVTEAVMRACANLSPRPPLLLRKQSLPGSKTTLEFVSQHAGFSGLHPGILGSPSTP